MGIENLFGGGGAQYIIDDTLPEKPDELARFWINLFLKSEAGGIVWAFYRKGPFGIIHVQDGIAIIHDKLQISRTYARRWHMPPQDYPETYLRGVKRVYLQLCGRENRAGGIEISPEGSNIGHYDFANPLKIIVRAHPLKVTSTHTIRANHS